MKTNAQLSKPGTFLSLAKPSNHRPGQVGSWDSFAKEAINTIRIGLWIILVAACTITSAIAQTNAPPTAVAPTPGVAPTAGSVPPTVTPTPPGIPGAAAAPGVAPTPGTTAAPVAAAVAPAATPAAPPAGPTPRSAADLEKLVAPIALYPDPLIATVLPASAYPLEIVQAARFVKDTNNLAKLDEQQWDANVKAVARIPDVINSMDLNIGWTSDLGDAFINQPKELMDAIQSMRTKAQGSGALQTTPQQTVIVTNQIVTNVVETQTVVVTNEVVQIEPTQPDVIYVPQYNPTVVYGGYPSAYVYPGYYPAYSAGAVATASVLSFGAGMAMGAWIGNDCDWGHGGVWGGGDIDIDRNVNINQNFNRNVNQNINRNVNAQKWQPNQNRLKNSGSTLSSANAQNRAARGWGGTSQAQAQARASAGTRGGFEAAGAQRPSSAQRPYSGQYSGQRPTASPGAAGANRPSPATRPSTTQRTSPTPRAQPSTPARSSSAFSGVSSGAGAHSYSQRGSASRGGGGGGGAARGGGGGRGGGGRR